MTCDGCKFWSELCAEWSDGGPMKALCLNKQSLSYGKMVSVGCNDRVEGRAIDDPSPTASEIK